MMIIIITIIIAIKEMTIVFFKVNEIIMIMVNSETLFGG